MNFYGRYTSSSSSEEEQDQGLSFSDACLNHDVEVIKSYLNVDSVPKDFYILDCLDKNEYQDQPEIFKMIISTDCVLRIESVYLQDELARMTKDISVGLSANNFVAAIDGFIDGSVTRDTDLWKAALEAPPSGKFNLFHEFVNKCENYEIFGKLIEMDYKFIIDMLKENVVTFELLSFYLIRLAVNYGPREFLEDLIPYKTEIPPEYKVELVESAIACHHFDLIPVLLDSFGCSFEPSHVMVLFAAFQMALNSNDLTLVETMINIKDFIRNLDLENVISTTEEILRLGNQELAENVVMKSKFYAEDRAKFLEDVVSNNQVSVLKCIAHRLMDLDQDLKVHLLEIALKEEFFDLSIVLVRDAKASPTKEQYETLLDLASDHGFKLKRILEFDSITIDTKVEAILDFIHEDMDEVLEFLVDDPHLFSQTAGHHWDAILTELIRSGNHVLRSKLLGKDGFFPSKYLYYSNHVMAEAVNLSLEISLESLLLFEAKTLSLKAVYHDFENSPLMLAISLNNFPLVKSILSHSTLLSPNDYHHECLYLACKLGNVDIVNALLDDPRLSIDSLDKSFIIAAKRSGQKNIVDLLDARKNFSISRSLETFSRFCQHATASEVSWHLHGNKVTHSAVVSCCHKRSDDLEFLHAVLTSEAVSNAKSIFSAVRSSLGHLSESDIDSYDIFLNLVTSFDPQAISAAFESNEISEGTVDLLKIAFENPANRNLRMCLSRTIFEAFQTGCTGFVESLIDKDIISKDFDDYVVLKLALAYEQSEIVKNAYKDHDFEGKSSELFNRALYSHFNLAEVIGTGISDDGLHHAVRAGYLDGVKYLLDEPARIPSSEYELAFKELALLGYNNILKAFRGVEEFCSAISDTEFLYFLFRTVKLGNDRAIKIVLRCLGNDISEMELNQNQHIIEAIQNEDSKILEILLKDSERLINYKFGENLIYSPLLHAIDTENNEIIQMIIDSTDIDCGTIYRNPIDINYGKFTLLDTSSGIDYVVEMDTEQEAELDSKGNNYYLAYALYREKYNAARLLLQNRSVQEHLNLLLVDALVKTRDPGIEEELGNLYNRASGSPRLSMIRSNLQQLFQEFLKNRDQEKMNEIKVEPVQPTETIDPTEAVSNILSLCSSDNYDEFSEAFILGKKHLTDFDRESCYESLMYQYQLALQFLQYDILLGTTDVDHIKAARNIVKMLSSLVLLDSFPFQDEVMKVFQFACLHGVVELFQKFELNPDITQEVISECLKQDSIDHASLEYFIKEALKSKDQNTIEIILSREDFILPENLFDLTRKTVCLLGWEEGTELMKRHLPQEMHDTICDGIEATSSETEEDAEAIDAEAIFENEIERKAELGKEIDELSEKLRDLILKFEAEKALKETEIRDKDREMIDLEILFNSKKLDLQAEMDLLRDEMEHKNTELNALKADILEQTKLKNEVLSNDLTSLTSRKLFLETNLLELQTKISDLNMEIAALEKNKSDLEEDSTLLETNFIEEKLNFEESLNDLKEENEKLEKEHARKISELEDEYRIKKEDFDKELEKLDKKKTKALRTISGLRKNKADVQDELDEILNKKRDRELSVQRLNDQALDKDRELQELVLNIDNATVEIGALGTSKTVLESEIITLVTDKSTLQTEVATLNSDITRKRSELGHVHDDVVSENTNLHRLNVKKVRLTGEVSALNASKSTVEGEIITETSAKTRLELDIVGLNSTKSSIEHDINELRAKVREKERKLIDLKDEKLDEQNRLASAQRKVSSEKRDLIRVESQKRRVDSDIRRARREKSDLNSEIESCKRDIARLEGEKSAMEIRITEKEAKVRETEDELLEKQDLFDETKRKLTAMQSLLESIKANIESKNATLAEAETKLLGKEATLEESRRKISRNTSEDIKRTERIAREDSARLKLKREMSLRANELQTKSEYLTEWEARLIEKENSMIPEEIIVEIPVIVAPTEHPSTTDQPQANPSQTNPPQIGQAAAQSEHPEIDNIQSSWESNGAESSSPQFVSLTVGLLVSILLIVF